MNQRTISTIKELESADWFSHCGEPRDGEVVVVGSWEEAARWCGSKEWLDLIEEASSRYSLAVSKRSPARFELWNLVVDECKGVTIPLVRRMIDKILIDSSIREVVENTVQWDVLHLCLEAEYADVYPPGFFASQGFWYVQGRFPCGWSGEFPSGRLVVF